MSYTEAELSRIIDEIVRLRKPEVEVEVELDGNGEEIITEEYEPYFDDGDDDFQARHFHPHDDFNYRPFGVGDLL